MGAGKFVQQGSKVPQIRHVVVPGTGAYVKVEPDDPTNEVVGAFLVHNTVGSAIRLAFEEAAPFTKTKGISASGILKGDSFRTPKFYLGGSSASGTAEVILQIDSVRPGDPNWDGSDIKGS